MRSKYWSCTKFADWIRGTKKIKCGTSEEWSIWRKFANAQYPVRFWIAEEALDNIQSFIYAPKDFVDSFSYWVYNRFIDKSWAIDTKLNKNTWHETDTKLLHGMFEELIDFVEIQKANMNSESRSWKRKHLPYFVRKLSIDRNWVAGVEYLIWETSLTQDHSWYGYDSDEVVPDDVKTDDWMKPTHQALAALETLELYCWWKYIRPMRGDPMDLSGYSDYFDSIRDDDGDIFTYAPKDSDSCNWQEAASNMCQAFELLQDQEDEDMMVRLIKIRKNLWT